ncbi:MAG: hypothetical protein ACI9EQ_001849, partial [Bacteroidia bacterium]
VEKSLLMSDGPSSLSPKMAVYTSVFIYSEINGKSKNQL